MIDILIRLEALFAGGMLLATFLSVGRKRLSSFLRYFAISSACLAGVIAVNALRTAHALEYGGALATLVVKAIAIPYLIRWTARRGGESFQLKPVTRPVVSNALALLAVVVAFMLSRRFPYEIALADASRRELAWLLAGLLFVALALMLLGLLLLILRRDIHSQIIGFLTLENGISALAVVALGGVPFMMEMGIFAVIGTGVLLMAVLSRQVHSLYHTHDTGQLRELVD